MSSDNQRSQADLSRFSLPTKTETVVHTAVCRLETSERKNDRIRDAIDQWQEIANHMADMMPSYPPHKWKPQTTTLWREVNKSFPDHTLMKHTAHEAAYKVAEAYGSWNSNGQPSADHPRGRFGNGNYIRFDHGSVELVENDAGYGVKLKIEPGRNMRRDVLPDWSPGGPEWFGVVVGDYQRTYFERVIDGDASTGSAEVRLEGDTPLLHLTVKWDVDVYDTDSIDQLSRVGVDIGERVIYAAAVVSPDGSIAGVDMKPGREFRHYRNRFDRKKSHLQERGDLRAVRQLKGERERYTESVLHAASRSIVDLARGHAPCAIVLEDLSHYRETADDPIHDFPFASLQEKIMYKSTAEGIPIVTVDPRDTSTTCRKCGQTDSEYRNGVEFSCRRCGYEVHADVNAAINIAGRARD